MIIRSFSSPLLINSSAAFPPPATYSGKVACHLISCLVLSSSNSSKEISSRIWFKAELGYKFQFPGGTAEQQYLHLCEVTEVVVGKKLTYSWRYDGYAGNSFVTCELFVVSFLHCILKAAASLPLPPSAVFAQISVCCYRNCCSRTA